MFAVRCAHTDLETPDFTFYRRESTKDIHADNKDSQEVRRSFTYTVAAGTAVTGTYLAGAVVKDFVSSMSAAQNVLAVSKIEVDLNEVPEGKNMVFKYRGKPLFVRHR